MMELCSLAIFQRTQSSLYIEKLSAERYRFITHIRVNNMASMLIGISFRMELLMTLLMIRQLNVIATRTKHA